MGEGDINATFANCIFLLLDERDVNLVNETLGFYRDLIDSRYDLIVFAQYTRVNAQDVISTN